MKMNERMKVLEMLKNETITVEEAEKGYLSDEEAMERNDVEDVDAERARIQSQPRGELALTEARADTALKWSDIFPREVALHLAGYSEAEVTDIMERVAKVKTTTSLDPQKPGTPVTPIAGNPPPTEKPPVAPVAPKPAVA
jgi:hypothetical protein